MATIGGRPKLLLMILVVLAAWAMHRREYPAAAFLGTLCFLTWQPTLMLVALVFFGAFVAGAGLRTMVAAAVATAVPVLAYEGYYWLSGGLEAQLFQAYTFPGTYMSHGFSDPLMHLTSIVDVWRRGYRVHPALSLAVLGCS
ncbi:MAG: hypothetical protein OEU54_12765 [Gemmatimonadota bacterium]|nr:hypothetical protein [Gemmatimonadota bacterium]